MEFSLTSRRQGDVVVVSACGELDATTSPRLSEELNRALDDDVACSGLVVDLADVGFCDSRCIGVLVATYRRSRELGVRLAVAAPQRPVYRLFVIAGIDQVLTIHQDVKTALSVLSANPEPTGNP
ncbi:MAG: anti-sigma factor antagonist [Streptosporangiales bacterium]|nr:anti-sigma factor antagonist [Streptosporangiales bacterium]